MTFGLFVPSFLFWAAGCSSQLTPPFLACSHCAFQLTHNDNLHCCPPTHTHYHHHHRFPAPSPPTASLATATLWWRFGATLHSHRWPLLVDASCSGPIGSYRPRSSAFFFITLLWSPIQGLCKPSSRNCNSALVCDALRSLSWPFVTERPHGISPPPRRSGWGWTRAKPSSLKVGGA